MTTNVPWVEKYRPQGVTQVLGHEEIVNTVKSLLRKGELPHILLHGPPGTGKTSIVQAIARTLHGPLTGHMVLELNASDDRGIGVVRNQLRTFAETRAPTVTETATGESLSKSKNIPQSQPKADLRSFFKPVTKPETELKIEVKPEPMDEEQLVRSQTRDAETRPATEYPTDIEVHPDLRKLKFVVLDECDQMTAAAQTALRRIMEKYAGHVRFFLMCNDVGKINPPIQSRCTKFRLGPIPSQFVRQKIGEVLQNEGVSIEPEAIEKLLDVAHGDFRKVMNTLNAASLSNPGQTITTNHILDSLGLPSDSQITAILDNLSSLPIGQKYDCLLNALYTDGLCLEDIIVSLYRTLMAKMDLDNQAYLTLLPRLADLELSLAEGVNPTIVCAGLAAAFQENS